MLTAERKKSILALVNEKSSVTVAELSKKLSVSEVTVRKLLNDLADQKLLARTHGGAISNAFSSYEKHEREKEKENTSSKKAIAQCAYSLIKPTDAIFLDAGSTTLELAKLIRKGNKRGLTVITNAFNIAGELLDEYDITIYFVGGIVRHNVLSCIGKFAEAYLREFYPNKAFIASNGFSAEKGVTTHNPNEAQIKIEALNAAEEKILLCDSSKYGKYAMGRIAPLSKFTKIISDTGLPEEAQKKIEATGTSLILADCSEMASKSGNT